MPKQVLIAVLGMSTMISGAAGAASDDSIICDEFRTLGWPDSGKLSKFVLTDTLQRGAKESAEQHFYNVDVDGDDVEDPIELGCSASVVRADPCTLNIELSSGGNITLEAWYLYLIRHRGETYALTADEVRGGHRIYRVGPKSVTAVCVAK